MKKALQKIERKFRRRQLFSEVDKIFIKKDKEQILRTKGIESIPNLKFRTGGKNSYAEWAHVAGIFQTIFYEYLNEHSNNYIIDIGCGTGLLSMACEMFINEKGTYLGLDVIKKNIDFSKINYSNSQLSFQHFDVQNLTYASQQQAKQIPWPIENESMNMVITLSVWTHLNQEDAIFYFCEVARVLKNDGIAVITFFTLMIFI